MNGHRRIGLLAASAALAITTLGAGSTFAAAPYTESWTGQYADSQFYCAGGFWAWGEWTINHSLTVYFDKNGNAVGDLERIDYTGRFFNPDTQVSVADRGTKRFLDTFAEGGGYASTVFTYQRTDKYVGEAGRVILGPSEEDGYQKELRSVGHFGFTVENMAALCEALAQ